MFFLNGLPFFNVTTPFPQYCVGQEPLAKEAKTARTAGRSEGGRVV